MGNRDAELATGDILAFSGNEVLNKPSFFAKIVRLFTKSEYSHVGVCVILEDIPFLLEAQIPEVKLTPLCRYSSYYRIAMGVKVPIEAVHEALSVVGEKYSIRVAIQAYFMQTDISDKKWICTELVHVFLKKVGVDVSECKTPSQVVKTLLKKFDKRVDYVSTV